MLSIDCNAREMLKAVVVKIHGVQDGMCPPSYHYDMSSAHTDKSMYDPTDAETLHLHIGEAVDIFRDVSFPDVLLFACR
jgi:hypothetical protein